MNFLSNFVFFAVSVPVSKEITRCSGVKKAVLYTLCRWIPAPYIKLKLQIEIKVFWTLIGPSLIFATLHGPRDVTYLGNVCHIKQRMKSLIPGINKHAPILFWPHHLLLFWWLPYFGIISTPLFPKFIGGLEQPIGN